MLAARITLTNLSAIILEMGLVCRFAVGNHACSAVGGVFHRTEDVQDDVNS